MRQLNTPDCSLYIERLSSLQGFAPHPTRLATRGRPLTCGGCTLQVFSLSAEGMNSGRREPMTGATGTHGAEGRPVKRQTCKKGLRGLWMFFCSLSHIGFEKNKRTGVSLLDEPKEEPTSVFYFSEKKSHYKWVQIKDERSGSSCVWGLKHAVNV